MIDHHLPDDPVEVLEGLAVALEEVLHALAHDELDEDHAAVAQGHDEGVQFPPRQVDAHVLLDLARQAEQVERLEKAVFALVEKAAKESFPTKEAAAEWIQDNAKGLAGRLAATVSKDGPVVMRKPRGVASAAACLGMAVLLTSKKGMPPEGATEGVETTHPARDVN